MKPSRMLPLLIVAQLLFLCVPADAQQRRRPGQSGQPQAAEPIELLGWDYARLGYTISPPEELALLFRNNRKEAAETAITWSLTTYAGAPVSQGSTPLKLEPGATGQVPIALPSDLKDGPYFINYSLGDAGRGGPRRIYFDFRRPVPDDKLNLNIVALIENMDAEGWTRTMLGPLARYVNVWSDWPATQQRIDAALVIAETIKDDDPRLLRLKQYVEQGGKMLVFGKPAASLSTTLPVACDAKELFSRTPQRLQTLGGGPWDRFQPADGPSHYGLRITAKPGSSVLAKWSEGAPAVVSGKVGKGQVVFVGASSGQVWQRSAALDGADELTLRLLYWMTGGERSVTAMLDRAQKDYNEEEAARTAVRDHALANLKIDRPKQFVVVSRNNVGRFGWLIEEGGLAENLGGNGVVTGPTTRSFSFGGTQPVVNVGALQDTGAEASLSFSVDGDTTPRSSDVQQNWFAKTVTWKYGNGQTVQSTLSLGSPGLLWEGTSRRAEFVYRSATHLAFASPTGIRIVARGESIAPDDLAEGWLLAFTARADVRDMPQLFVLTRRPVSIRFEGGIQVTYGDGGFGAALSSRLWGIRLLAAGQTVAWAKQVPHDAVAAARRWNRLFLSFPVDCDEVAWVDGEQVLLADRYKFRTIKDDWGTQPLSMASLPPALSLAKAAGAPLELPQERSSLDCATKFGPLEAVPGDTTLVRVPLPPRDHRALIPVEGQMVLQEALDQRAAGLGFGQTKAPAGKNEGAGSLHADLAPYDRSGSLPFNEAPCIDVYKWWYTFNALLARPVYSPSIREKVDRHFRTRYWETLNFYPHKCFVVQKREPWSGVEYLISFVWPTQTQYGWRNFNDANEASGINAYCFANYARYYGDWATLRANWNFCRRLHEYLPRVNDWATMASGALEYWRVAGLDMVNSEPYGNLAFAYAAANAGHPQDELVGLVHGARSLVTAVARFGLADYLQAISAEGDPWREFRGHYWLLEDGIQASRPLLGSIGLHDTSKGTNHELSLAYKLWVPERVLAQEKALETAGQNASPDLTQRLFLGWDPARILEQARHSSPRQPGGWQATTAIYDLALACIGDVPLFLCDWSPPEYISGSYDADRKQLNLVFRSHEGEPFTAKLYSQREPSEVAVNGHPLEQSAQGWRYDAKLGWLTVFCKGADEKHLRVVLGEPAAPLHPYFTKVSQ